MKEKRLEMLNARLTEVNSRLTEEQSKETPNNGKVARLTERKTRIQGRIDELGS